MNGSRNRGTEIREKEKKGKGCMKGYGTNNRRQSIQAEKKERGKKKEKKEVSRSGKPEGNRYWGKGERKKCMGREIQKE